MYGQNQQHMTITIVTGVNNDDLDKLLLPIINALSIPLCSV